MTSTSQPEPTVRQVRIRAPRELVFAHWVEPEKMLKWLGVSAELDPKPGGICRINVTGRDIMRGEFKEVVPNEKLVLSWGWEAAGHPIPVGSTEVEVGFTENGEQTIVRVEHRGLPKSEELNQAYGWQHYLGRLGVLCVGRDPGPDPWVVPGS
jgi:uncharacterized protein YndB with AHSA1/START domain